MTGTRHPAFGHNRLAAALGKTIGTSFDSSKLPFESFTYLPGGAGLRLKIENQVYVCATPAYQCAVERRGPRPGELLSPDRQWAVFLRDGNLWLRATASDEECALTQDGEPHHAYGVSPGSLAEAAHGSQPSPAVAVWSPDSGRIFTAQVDERQVRTVSMLQSAAPESGSAAVLHQYRAAFAGDSRVPTLVPVVIDRVSGSVTRANMPPAYAIVVNSIVAVNEVRRVVYFSAQGRDAARDPYLPALIASGSTAGGCGL